MVCDTVSDTDVMYTIHLLMHGVASVAGSLGLGEAREPAMQDFPQSPGNGISKTLD